MCLKILILHFSLSGFFFNTDLPAENIIKLDSAGLKISFFGQDENLFEVIEFDHIKRQLKFKLRHKGLNQTNRKATSQNLSKSIDPNCVLIHEKNFNKGYLKYNLHKDNQAQTIYISVMKE